MDIQQNEYMGHLTPDAGAVIDITTGRQMPFPFEQGIKLAPGFSTSVGLRMVSNDDIKTSRNRLAIVVSVPFSILIIEDSFLT